MQTAVEEFRRETSAVREINVEITESASCTEIRERLDRLFGGDERLEEARVAVKQVLFGHLQSCKACCRSFDVRVRFRSVAGRGIY